MREEIEKIRKELLLNLNNPEWIAQNIMRLSSLNIEVGEAASTARLNQERVLVGYLDIIVTDGKKMSKTEAESRAMVETMNEYEELDNLREDIAELVNSMKKNLDVLSWGYKNS